MLFHHPDGEFSTDYPSEAQSSSTVHADNCARAQEDIADAKSILSDSHSWTDKRGVYKVIQSPEPRTPPSGSKPRGRELELSLSSGQSYSFVSSHSPNEEDEIDELTTFFGSLFLDPQPTEQKLSDTTENSTTAACEEHSVGAKRSLSKVFAQIDMGLESKADKSSDSLNSQKQLQELFQQWENLFLEEDLQLAQALQASHASFENNQHAKNLNKRAQDFGFTAHDMPHDGLCLLHAIAHQLKNLHQQDEKIDALTYEHLNQRLIDHLAEHITDYQAHSVLTPHELVSQALDYKRQWASEMGDFASLALSRALNMTVVIIPSDGSNPRIFRRPEPQAILYLGHEDGRHYQSFIRVPDMQPDCNINLLVEKETMDSWQEHVQQKIHFAPIMPFFKSPTAAPTVAQHRYDRILISNTKYLLPLDIDSNTVVMQKNDTHLTAYLNEKGEIASKSLSR